ncbi:MULTISPECIES: hypothetical protein [unclassified Bradyrhizobium]
MTLAAGGGDNRTGKLFSYVDLEAVHIRALMAALPIKPTLTSLPLRAAA